MLHLMRYCDPYLNRFLQPDSIIPNLYNPQSLNRFSYVSNRPINYTDPSGHRECESRDGQECDWKTPYLWNQAESILKRLGGKNDLEAMTKIIREGARVYRDFKDLLPALSAIFLGVDTYGPGALWAAKSTGCAGVGREPHDCSSATDYFSDTGFNSDFRDGHNQIFHLWGYIANTSTPGNSALGFAGLFVATFANGFHEIDQSNIAKVGQKFGIQKAMDLGWGTSWQDFTLSIAGMKIGSLITNQAISPSELADVIQSSIGPLGSGSNGELQSLQNAYGPLYGSP